MPAARTDPLAVSLMAITKDDDLETANIHDTPIHVQWSARGNMAIAVGSAYRIFSSVRPGEVIPEPWSIQPTVVAEGIDGTGFSPFPIEMSRGRSPSAHPPTFGRGDEDGFPALTSAGPSPRPSPRFKPSPLPGSKAKEGTVTPAHRSVPASPYHKGNVELPSSPGPVFASLATPSPASGSRQIAGASKVFDSNASSRTRNAGGRSWRRAIDRTQALIDEDISMVMRRRVLAGYGLSHVRFMVTTWTKRPPSHLVLLNGSLPITLRSSEKRRRSRTEGRSLRCGPGSIVRAQWSNRLSFTVFLQMLVECWRCPLTALTATILPIRVYRGSGRGFHPLFLMQCPQI